MFYATLPEKLGLLSLLLEASEKIKEQSRFEMENIEELVFSSYSFLRPYGYGEKEMIPPDFLMIFNSLVNPEYWNKAFKAAPEEEFKCIDDIQLFTLGVSPSKEIVNILNAHSFLEDGLEYILRDFMAQDTLCNFMIRAIESFSHYVVIRNLGLPISKLDESRSVKCNALRNTLYNFLDATRDVPQFIALLQTRWKDIQKNHYHLLEENKTIETFMIDTIMLGEIAKSLKDKFSYAGRQLFEQHGAWFPDRLYYCDLCKKAIVGSGRKLCCGIKTHHPQREMKESCGIFLHENLSEALPYISEYLVIHTLRRLLFEDKLFGFLAHSVFFDEEEIDIIALILLKNYAKVFPIEIQISSLSGDEIEKTEDKFQKLGDLLKDVKYPEGRIEVHNLFITFEEPKEEHGKNFSIHHFSKLNETVRNLIYSIQ
jgi:hypothetical protein